MYEITEVILEMFDVKRLKNLCNFPECENKPTKEIFIYEYTIKRKVGIINLYLCDEHIHIYRELMKKIRQINPRMIVQSEKHKIKI